MVTNVNNASAAEVLNQTTKKSSTDAQDRFLKLLVAQLQNQDPMNPMDNAQMTSQIAQINTVNGITQLNETMQTVASQIVATQNIQAAALIGKSVEVVSDRIVKTDGSAPITMALPLGADSVTVTVLNEAGLPLRTFEMGKQEPGRATAVWDGKTNDGQSVADGKYRIEVVAKAGGVPVEAVPLGSDQVSGVTVTSGQAQLQLSRLGGVRLGDVISIL
jgi:flagellar basal-body rod modification protein FlgD